MSDGDFFQKNVCSYMSHSLVVSMVNTIVHVIVVNLRGNLFQHFWNWLLFYAGLLCDWSCDICCYRSASVSISHRPKVTAQEVRKFRNLFEISTVGHEAEFHTEIRKP